MEQQNTQWMNVQEVASYLGLKVSTIYSYVSKKSIPHYKRGGIVRFRKEQIDLWMESSRVEIAD